MACRRLPKQFLPFRIECPPVPEAAAHLLELGLMSAAAVQEPELFLAADQADMLVLPVHLHQQFAKLRQLLQCDRGAVDPRARPAVRTDDAAQQALTVAIELVADRVTKEPFAPEMKLNQVIKRLSMEQGLMSYPMGGTVDGRVGDHILLAPPYIVEKAHIDRIVDILGKVLDTATQKERAA